MEMIKFLVGNRIRFETCSTKDRCVFCWKILVDFELQALISSGEPTAPTSQSVKPDYRDGTGGPNCPKATKTARTYPDGRQ
jgi:hypothetical protein